MNEEEELVEAMTSILEECGRKRETAAHSGSRAEIIDMEEGQHPPKRSRQSQCGPNHKGPRHPEQQNQGLW